MSPSGFSRLPQAPSSLRCIVSFASSFSVLSSYRCLHFLILEPNLLFPKTNTSDLLFLRSISIPSSTYMLTGKCPLCFHHSSMVRENSASTERHDEFRPRRFGSALQHKQKLASLFAEIFEERSQPVPKDPGSQLASIPHPQGLNF